MDTDLISRVEIEKRWSALQAVSSGLLTHMGPKFTNTPDGHIQTDIAAAGSLAGLMLLQDTVDDLRSYLAKADPGNVILSEVHDGQQLIHRFMCNVAIGNGIDPRGGWFDPVSEDNYPMFRCEEMTRKLATPFYDLCEKTSLELGYYKFAAALAAIRLAGAGIRLDLLGAGAAKSIAFYHVVAGSKTLPHSEALWTY